MWYKIITYCLILTVTACASAPVKAYGKRKGTQLQYRINGKWYTPLKSSYGFEETGIASWYGRDFHGRKTSNGEIYDMHATTAAHKTLPMNTYVRVTRLDNGKEIIARINDRGPFVRGRVIDLSYKVAKELGMDKKGTARVRVVALGDAVGDKLVKKDYDKGIFYVQVGAFVSIENAVRLKERLEKRYGKVVIVKFNKDGKVFHRVRIGSLTTMKEAEKIRHRVEAAGFKAPFVVAD